VDSAGNLYIADRQNDRIRKVNPQGVITTVAGSAKSGFSGDPGPATSAALTAPESLAVAPDGTLYIADSDNFLIRAVNPASGVIRTVAGGGTSFLDGPALQASLELPWGLAIDSQGNLLMALFKGRQVRRMTPQGIITSIAGQAPAVAGGDNIAAKFAPLLYPWSTALDTAGNVFIADWVDNRIRKVSTSGTITTFAGNGIFALPPDGSPATQFGGPRGLAFDNGGNLYATSGAGSVVEKIAPNGTASRVAGGGPGITGASGIARNAVLRAPFSIAFDPSVNY